MSVPGALTEPRRLKVLMSAYACEPSKGSEPGVGWNTAVQVAARHDVWLLTRTNNREVIEQELARNPRKGLTLVYFDLPSRLRWWKRGSRGVQIYYYLWQIGARRVARRLHQRHTFDISHHVTFGRYWSPTALASIDVPLVWGVVGGGESAPSAFVRELPLRDRMFEATRSLVRSVAERDVAVLRTARRASRTLAATDETAVRVRAMGATNVSIAPQVALTSEQLEFTARLGRQTRQPRPFRFLSIGRPLPWKGFHLGIRAFAAAQLENVEYWLLVNGRERAQLEQLANSLRLGDRVRFVDRLPGHEDVFALLSECDVLVHPALHEAFGNVVLEAMACGKPILCLDLGGPALQVGASCGRVVPSSNPRDTVQLMAEAMRDFVHDPDTTAVMGQAARQRAESELSWDAMGRTLEAAYRGAAEGGDTRARS